MMIDLSSTTLLWVLIVEVAIVGLAAIIIDVNSSLYRHVLEIESSRQEAVEVAMNYNRPRFPYWWVIPTVYVVARLVHNFVVPLPWGD